MCLLVALFQLDPARPVVLAANRDEFHARAACPMTTLGEGAGGRILGGLDHVSGGTWLAVNEAGVVAGLTNRPLPDGPDKDKRSRGELPLRLVRHATAADAVAAFVDDVRPADYNPAWLLVADRTQLFYVDVTGDEGATAEELAPGVHILENRPIAEPSPKADRVRSLLAVGAGVPELAALLGDHEPPAGPAPEPEASPVAVAARCICVHAPGDEYGTRSSTIVTLPAAPAALPDVRYSGVAPCAATWHDAGELWRAT